MVVLVSKKIYRNSFWIICTAMLCLHLLIAYFFFEYFERQELLKGLKGYFVKEFFEEDFTKEIEKVSFEKKSSIGIIDPVSKIKDFSLTQVSKTLINRKEELEPIKRGLLDENFKETDLEKKKFAIEETRSHAEYIKIEESANRYLFRLEIFPDEQLSFLPLKQKITFLIDRSQAITEESYEQAKQAVLEALSQLKEGCTFNIVLFDQQIQKFSSENIENSLENIVNAQEFLLQAPYTGGFACFEFSEFLDKSLMESSEDEILTAIFFSGGQLFFNKEQEIEKTLPWIDTKKRKEVLFAITEKSEDFNTKLDYLMTVHQGSLKTTEGAHLFNTALSDLLKEIQHPLGSEISISTMAEEGREFMLISSELTNRQIYKDRPFVILGLTNSLDPFEVKIEGKNRKIPFHFNKIINFKKSEKALDPSLDFVWNLNKSYEDVLRFSHDGDLKHLKMAQERLIPYQLNFPY